MEVSKSVMRERQALLMALFLCAVAAVPLFYGAGIVNTRAGGDSPFLIVRLQQLVSLLREGSFPPRWMPDAAYSYGYPFFNHYAALPYYVGALFNLLGWGYLASIKLTQALGFLAAALAMYGLVHYWTKNWRVSFLSAMAYAYAPFHLVNVYVRGDSLSEFYAFIFYPLILWALARLRSERAWRNAVLLALSYAGLALTHNVSFVIFTPFVVLYILLSFMGASEERWRLLSRALLGLVGGLALSAWFWWPAFMERGLGHMADMATGYFHFSGHFRGLDLVQPALFFDYAITAQQTPFAMGLFQAVMTLVGVIALVWDAAKERRISIETGFGVVALLLSALLITPLSRPLWEHLPLLALVQFPWRFLSVQAFAGALVIGQVARIFARTRLNSPWLLWALGAVFVLTSMLRLDPERLQILEQDVNTERLRLFEAFTGNIGTTVRYEYLPKWVDTRPLISEALIHRDAKGSPLALEGEIRASQLVANDSTSERWRVAIPSESATLAFQTYYFPGWRAWIDGTPAEISPADGLGFIQLRMPGGEHEIVLRFGGMRSRNAVQIASLLSAILALASLLATGAPRRGWVRSAGQLTLVALGIGLLGWLWPEEALSGEGLSDLTMDFARQPYLHHNPEGVSFEGDATLLGYQFSESTLEAGGALRIKAQWDGRSLEGLRADMRMVSMAEPLFGLDDPLASSQSPIREGASDHVLSVPSDAVPGIYLISLRLWDGDEELSPLTDDGETLGTTYLQPLYLRITLDGNAPERSLGRFGSCIDLVDATAIQEGANLRVETLWSTTCQPMKNYAMSARLRRADGYQLSALDIQPHYGFYPTSFWRMGQHVPDRFTLAVPEGTPPGSHYVIEIVLYDPKTLQAIGTVSLPDMILPQPTIRTENAVLASLSAEIDLIQVELANTEIDEGQSTHISALWAAAEAPSRDYACRIILEEEGGGLALEHALPLAEEYPTVRWPEHALIASTFPLSDLAPGTYVISLGLVDADTDKSYGSYVLASRLLVRARPKAFQIPPMQHPLPTNLGDLLTFLGYDLEQDARSLRMTLYWQAIGAVGADYKVFVHVFDPATETIIGQHDAMPRENTYPTSIWAKGEVVSESIEIPLAGAVPGLYHIGLGLYDSVTGDRLGPRLDTAATISGNRIILPTEVRIP